MAKDVKGMPLDLGDDVMKLSVRVARVEVGVGVESAREFLLGRLAVLDRIIRIAQIQVVDLVHEIRDLPLDERGKWSEIGEALEINADAALKRFSATPKPRTEKPGHSVSAAAQALGISRTTVYNRVYANPDAAWFTQVATNGKVRKTAYRILDMNGLDVARVK